VQAVLCWSEYYNGKWQPTKTSDVNCPIEIASFPSAGENAFDRSILGLWAYEDSSISPVAPLRILIGYGSDLAVAAHLTSFLLYNTHSLPVIDKNPSTSLNALFYSRPHRYLYTSGEYLVAYYPTSWLFSPNDMERHVLKNTIDDRTITPQPLQDPWAVPFFYEDSNHVFFVRTTDMLEVPTGYGMVTDGGSISKLPIYTEGHVPFKPVPVEFEDLRLTSPTRLQLFVSEDANIHQHFGIGGTVPYGDAEIGSSGSVVTALSRRRTL
jgi:hypothetical protein